MIDILEKICERGECTDPLLLGELVHRIRPKNPNDVTHATAKIEELLSLVTQYPHLGSGLRAYVRYLFYQTRQLNAYTEAGILPGTGFFTEIGKRIRHKFLPALVSENDVMWFIRKVFLKKNDYKWVTQVPDELYRKLFTELNLFHSSLFDASNRLQLVNAVMIISHRISGLGLEPEITDRVEKVEKLDSPFIVQGNAIIDYTECMKRGQVSPEEQEGRYRHVMNLLDECDALVNEIRENRQEIGASLALTYLLVRLRQNIGRARLLLRILYGEQEKTYAAVKMFKELVAAENLKDSIVDHINQNIDLLAFQVVEHAGKTGEHYITRTRKEYIQFLKASMGGGFIVGFLAMIKLGMYYLKLAPFWQAFAYSMNYAFGFIMIHVTHSALATKQPAMTAAHIAGSLDSRKSGVHVSLPGLALMVARVFRSQFVSFVGNLMLCFPMGVILAALYFLIAGQPIADTHKAWVMIEELHPWQSRSLFYAAVTGVCLFISGLISGYFDNMVIFRQIPERLRAHRFLRKAIGTRQLDRFSRYIEHNLGSLMGNFFLGVFLGSLWLIGEFFGFPLDIRHITFAAASFGIALVTISFDMPAWEYIVMGMGILGIGFFNFLFSFGLAFLAATKSRKISFRQTSMFFVILRNYFFRHPLDFLVAPKHPRTEDDIFKHRKSDAEINDETQLH